VVKHESHRHRFHVSGDRLVRDGHGRASLVDADHFSFEIVSLHAYRFPARSRCAEKQKRDKGEARSSNDLVICSHASDSPTSTPQTTTREVDRPWVTERLLVTKLLILRALSVLCGCFPELIQRNRRGR